MVLHMMNMIKLWKIPRRFLNLQEYQCNSILRESLLVVQPLQVVTNSDSATKAAKELGISKFVIKAQILAGGRGKGVFSSGFMGGVHITNENEIPQIVSQMIGNRLITKQTSPEGVLVTKVAIGEALAIEKETYVAVFMDPGLGMPVLIGSPCGGIDIEEIAKKYPNKIFKVFEESLIKEAIDIFSGPTSAQCLRMAKNLEFPEKFHDEVADQLKKLYEMAIKIDALQVEINPFILGKNNKSLVVIVCLDAKISIDDNAQFRQKDIFDLEDSSETPEVEYKAIQAGLAYIQMDGDIGCLVNGAGLAMATLDIVELYGGSPSNFLDIGGTADEERVLAALKIFAIDKRVRKIFINVFGGIVDCEIISRGVINAKNCTKNLQPIVMRLQGNNCKIAREAIEVLNDSSIILVEDLDEAAKLVCAVSG
ncbi:hypothetical protein MXB_4955 [Myxobolus squamalis]|nr:hypothetical protein MXB_4955 [Myxobolus squamalis]